MTLTLPIEMTFETKIRKKEGQFIVSLYTRPFNIREAVYETNDKEDAKGTASAMLEHADQFPIENSINTRLKMKFIL